MTVPPTELKNPSEVSIDKSNSFVNQSDNTIYGVQPSNNDDQDQSQYMTANSNFKSARGGGMKLRTNKEEDELINKIHHVLNDVQDYMANLTPELIANASMGERDVSVKNTNHI